MPALYAILSRETYSVRERGIPNNLPDDWRIARVDVPKGVWGNCYVVFVSDELKEIVVSVRGTDNVYNVLTDIGLALAQIQSVPFIPPGQHELNALIKDILNSEIIKQQNYKLKVIGHSLGGVMAELSAIKFGLECITFESPGSLNIMQQFPNKFPSERFNLITSYLSAPNVINTLNFHAGTVYRMHLPHNNGFFNGWHLIECLLNALFTSATYLSINAAVIPAVLFKDQLTRELAKQIAKRSFILACCSKLGSKVFNWRDDLTWLEGQHSIANIAEFLKHDGAKTKMIEWPIIWNELKDSKLTAIVRDFLPLQKDRPGIRNVFDENGMREAQIQRIAGYQEEVVVDNQKGIFRKLFKLD